MKKLRFKVVHCSGEDEEFPSSELNRHSPSTRGWQSAKHCEYPQEIGLVIPEGEKFLTQLQILSHQSKIASKIDLFVGQGNDYHSASFKRLGYLSLDNNEQSNYQARELKTIHINRSASFLRLLIHKCHINKLNLFNQVGLIAINLVGQDDELADDSKSRAGTNAKDTHDAKSTGSVSSAITDLSLDLNLDEHTASKLRSLAEAKSRAVASEDYMTAKQIKSVEADLKELGSRLAQLDIAKKQAVKHEDYDRAAALKQQSDELREQIEEKVHPTPTYYVFKSMHLFP